MRVKERRRASSFTTARISISVVAAGSRFAESRFDAICREQNWNA